MPRTISIDELRDVRPLFLLHQALHALGATPRDTRPGDVERIEAFWSFEGSDQCSGGFVLGLVDGRRAYLDVWVELAEDEGADPAKVDIEFTALPENQKYPRFPSTSDPPGGWRHDVDMLNDSLRR